MPVKRLIIGVLIVMIMVVSAFYIYYSYNNWVKMKEIAKKMNTDIKKKVPGVKAKTN